MKKYLVRLNGSSFKISPSIASVFLCSGLVLQQYTNREGTTLILDNTNTSYLQLVPTKSLSHFYVLIFETKHRISKQLYFSLSSSTSQLIKSISKREITLDSATTHVRLADMFSGTGSAV